MPLLISDLDNTLYDWVSFFSTSFQAMTAELAPLVGKSRDELYDEFKTIHQGYGNSEQPFAALELPSVLARFSGKSRRELVRLLEVPLNAFNEARRRQLTLYETVRETLITLRNRGVTIVGHTEAISVNAYYRLRTLEIDRFFTRLYCLQGRTAPHPIPERGALHAPPPDFVRLNPPEERKPNPRLLLDICQREGFDPRDAWYVGDSLSRDISMACEAGVKAIWARYGTVYQKHHWTTLVRITHWTEEDVTREAKLREAAKQVVPDYTIDSFSDLLGIILQPGSRASG